MGVEVTHFEELEAMGEYDEENDEAEQLGTGEEWSDEDQRLKNEEVESEKENDDWWFN